VFGPCAATAFYHPETFRMLEGFDESFFCYYEDVDLAFRFRLLGYRCIQLADARLFHFGSAFTGREISICLVAFHPQPLVGDSKKHAMVLLIYLLPAHLLVTVYLLYRFRKTDRFGPLLSGFEAGMLGLSSALVARRKIQARRRASSLNIARSFTWSIKNWSGMTRMCEISRV
jgi:N-acetylglucosaminyl-diphospho-decaprenol L-rhamnosyltransferase